MSLQVFLLKTRKKKAEKSGAFFSTAWRQMRNLSFSKTFFNESTATLNSQKSPKANFRSLKYPHNNYSHPISIELTQIHCCLVISIETRRQKTRRHTFGMVHVPMKILLNRSNDFADQLKSSFVCWKKKNIYAPDVKEIQRRC